MSTTAPLTVRALVELLDGEEDEASVATALRVAEGVLNRIAARHGLAVAEGLARRGLLLAGIDPGLVLVREAP